MKKSQETSLIMPVTPSFIERRILIIRGQKVMLDSDLAELYQTPTMRLNEQVKRNKDRFPSDFMFQLTKSEKQEVIAICDNLTKLKFSYREPYVFTELGVAMLSSILKSGRAVQMNIFIMRAFVALRRIVADDKNLVHRVDKLELEQMKQGKDLDIVYGHIKRFMDLPIPSKEKLGF